MHTFIRCHNEKFNWNTFHTNNASFMKISSQINEAKIPVTLKANRKKYVSSLPEAIHWCNLQEKHIVINYTVTKLEMPVL